MSYTERTAETAASGYAGCWFLMIVINLTIGAWCFAYSLLAIAGKILPWYANIVGGLLLGQFAIPIACICWLLKLCGVDTPFIH